MTNLKDHELVFVTENNRTIHYNDGDYIHIGSHDEAWTDEVMSKSSFIDRWLAEKDNTIVQFIPYIVCMREDGRIFSYRRKSGGETRLEGKRSIGIGGHVNSDDKPFEGSPSSDLDKQLQADLSKVTTPNTWDIVLNGAIREACEELSLERDYVRDHLIEVGTMYTPTDGSEKRTQAPKVGEVHLGIVYKLTIPDTTTLRPDEGMIQPGFLDDLNLDLNDFEYWSQLVIQNIEEINKI